MPVTACEFKSHPAYIQIVHIVSFKSWLYGFFLFKQPIGLHYSVIGEGGSQIMMKKPHPHIRGNTKSKTNNPYNIDIQ